VREFLLRGFDYDLWANQKWVQMLGKFKSSQRALEIFEHIMGAQRIWLTRCGLHVEQVENIAFAQLVTSLSQTWKSVVEDGDLSAWVEYQTMAGEEYQTQLGDIAAHVINHGTYHRGQLRMLAEIDGIEFPDTDLVHFVRTLA
jgi:uncharacterized damage-inducible protein DinB